MTTIYSKSGTDAAISAATGALTPEDVGADPAGTAAAAIAALGLGTAAQSDATDFAPASSAAYPVQQVTLTGSLAYALPVDAPADQVISVVFTQDGTGGHTVTYDGAPVAVALAAGASTEVEFWPGGAVVYPGAAGGGGAVDSVNGQTGAVALGIGYKLEPVTETANPAHSIIGSIDGIAYAASTDGVAGIWRSADDGATWRKVSTQRAYGIFPAGDGEVIVNTTGELRKSSGWATNPTTATFTTVAESNGASAFIQSSVDAWENYVVASEYGLPRVDARYIWLSVDYGATFTSVLDLSALYPGQESATHWHAVCIDPWHTGPNPRLWASHGDGPRGVYYSDDLGANWTLYANDWQPMPLIATPNGIVAATDANDPDGVWLIPRTLGPRELLLRISGPYWAGSGLGFGASTARDPRDPSRVVVTFRADQQTHFTSVTRARIFVSDGFRASEVYAAINTATLGVTGSVNWEAPPAITASGKVLATYSANGGRWTVTGQLKPATHSGIADPGNILTGTAVGRTAIAIGQGTISANQSVVIGSEAGKTFAPGTDSRSVAVGEESSIRTRGAVVGYQAAALADGVAVGYKANAGVGAGSVAVGAEASAAGDTATAVGRLASAASTSAVAVGKSATAAGAAGVAVGFQPSAAGYCGIAIGHSASATAQDSTAIGKSAVAGHASSVALGDTVSTTANSQVAIGPRHIEMTELAATPVNVGVNQARLFLKDNGAGKTQLCIIFNTGSSQVIATEP